MKKELFNKLYRDAKAQPDVDMYIAEYGYPDFFDEISTDLDEIVSTLRHIHCIASMTFKDLLLESGLTLRAFSAKFMVPLRTVEDWSSGKSRCSEYVKLMIAELLGIVQIKFE